MSDDEVSPIRIAVANPLDQYMARLSFKTDNNCPNSADNSVDVRGSVDFGIARQMGKSGRTYEIGAREAFLEIVGKNCDFHPNPEMEKRVSDHEYQETVTSKKHVRKKVGGLFGLKVPALAQQASLDASVSGNIDSERDHDVIAKRDYYFFWQHWMSCGFQIGDAGGKKPEILSAAITGRFLSGIWGCVKPFHRANSYYVEVSLLLSPEALTVVPTTYRPKDIFGLRNKLRPDDAFAALKSAVAAWVVAEELQLQNRAGGFDNQRNQLVIAHGRIDVNLSSSAPKIDQLASKPELKSYIAPPRPKRRNGIRSK